MENKIKSAFDEIKAEQGLKTATKYLIYEHTHNTRSEKPSSRKMGLSAVAACLAFILCSSFLAYSIPVSAISLDTGNTSVELGVNCFDKVVKITCFDNEEAVPLLNLKNKNYKDAVSVLIKSTENCNDSAVLTVSCKNNKRSNRMTEEIRNCHSADTQVQPVCGNHTLAKEAHSHGISTGKYSAYLTLKQYEPSITPEEAAVLTMKELRERIAFYENDSKADYENETAITTSSKHHSESTGKHHGEAHH